MDAVADHKLIPGLLLLVLSFVIVMGIFMVYLVLRWRHAQRMGVFTLFASEKTPAKLPPVARAWSFKRPTCWLAIRNRDLLAVQSALRLHHPKPCSWTEGLSGNAGQTLFISPPISGWILVIGPALPDPADDVDVCFRFLLDLSHKLGHVQFFHANGMLHQHAWAQLDSGHVVRGYAWAGKTLWNQGELTRAEQQLKLKCYDYLDAVDIPQLGSTDLAARNSEKVHLLAASWSVDPDDIDERFFEKEWGVTGELSQLF
jgi:hypothetical protein